MTKAIVLQDVYQGILKKHDKVKIVGYTRAADDRPYAVAIRESDGYFDLVMLHQIRAIEGSY